MALFISCADRRDYQKALEKKGYKIIYAGSYDIIVQEGNKLGTVYVDNNAFRSTIESDDYKEYVHWFDLKIDEGE